MSAVLKAFSQPERGCCRRSIVDFGSVQDRDKSTFRRAFVSLLWFAFRLARVFLLNIQAKVKLIACTQKQQHGLGWRICDSVKDKNCRRRVSKTNNKKDFRAVSHVHVRILNNSSTFNEGVWFGSIPSTACVNCTDTHLGSARSSSIQIG